MMITKIILLLLCIASIVTLCIVYRVIAKMPSEEKGSPRARKIGIIGAVAALGIVVFFYWFTCEVTGESFFELKVRGTHIWKLALIAATSSTICIIILLKYLKNKK